MGSWDPVEERQSAGNEDSQNAPQIYKASILKKEVFERRLQVKQKDAKKAERNWTEIMQFSVKDD